MTNRGKAAIDICKTGETKDKHLKNLAIASDTSEIHVLRHRDEKTENARERKGARRTTNTTEELTNALAWKMADV